MLWWLWFWTSVQHCRLCLSLFTNSDWCHVCNSVLEKRPWIYVCGWLQLGKMCLGTMATMHPGDILSLSLRWAWAGSRGCLLTWENVLNLYLWLVVVRTDVSGSCGHGRSRKHPESSFGAGIGSENREMPTDLVLFLCMSTTYGLFLVLLLDRRAQSYVLCVTERSFLWAPLSGCFSFLPHSDSLPG